MRKKKIAEVSAKVVQHAILDDDGNWESVITTLVRTPLDLNISEVLSPPDLEQLLVRAIVETN